jgi:hypothetical protein
MSDTAQRLDPKCDPATRPVAYAICSQVYLRTGCVCAHDGVGPCANMTLAACAAEKAIEQREGAR